jgi:hypothetical protein
LERAARIDLIQPFVGVRILGCEKLRELFNCPVGRDGVMSLEEILVEVGSLGSLVDVLKWATSRTPPAEFIDAVAQDEYTHDVVVRVSPDAFVVFDTT